MKKIFLMLAIPLVGMSAFAGTLTCKKFDEATAQGYEAKISKSKAVISYKGKKVARLEFVSKQRSFGGDQEAVTKYSQNITNGYSLEVRTGAVTGLSSAILSQGGVAGLTPIATLNDCK